MFNIPQDDMLIPCKMSKAKRIHGISKMPNLIYRSGETCIGHNNSIQYLIVSPVTGDYGNEMYLIVSYLNEIIVKSFTLRSVEFSEGIKNIKNLRELIDKDPFDSRVVFQDCILKYDLFREYYDDMYTALVDNEFDEIRYYFPDTYTMPDLVDFVITGMHEVEKIKYNTLFIADRPLSPMEISTIQRLEHKYPEGKLVSAYLSDYSLKYKATVSLRVDDVEQSRQYYLRYRNGELIDDYTRYMESEINTESLIEGAMTNILTAFILETAIKEYFEFE